MITRSTCSAGDGRFTISTDYQEVGGSWALSSAPFYPRGADNRLVPEPVLVSIDISHILFRS